VTATVAAKNFGALADHVRETGVAYVVERKGRPIVRIVPVGGRRCTLAELARWFESRRAPADDYRAAIRDHVDRQSPSDSCRAMAALIDASILIDVERGRLALEDLAARHGDEDVAISAITASELLHGVHRVSRAKAARADAFVEGLLALLPVLPFDLAEARIHARLSAELQARGIAVGAHDLLIAATAISTDSRIITRDLRSFPKIAGLDVLKI
jgi:tRNA(fMet)-specific endonuclease VapC